MITALVVIVHIVVSLALILIVLLQVGKGGSLGAAFGGAGSSQTLFGSRGPATFLSRLTAVMATLFMLTSLGLAYISSHARQRSTIIDQIPATESAPLPVSPPESAPAPTPPAESTPAPPPPAESMPATPPAAPPQQ